MNKVIVTGFRAVIFGGVIELTKEQAATRSHKIAHVKGDLYDILSPVEFKAGEVFGYDGELPKDILDLVEEIEDAPKRGRKPKADGDGEE